MDIIGCTADKLLKRCTIPVAQILRLGIDPCGVDLCEQYPLSCEVEGTRLLFSPARRLLLCVEHESGTYAVMIMGPHRQVFSCGAGKLTLAMNSDLLRFEIDEVQPLSVSFESWLQMIAGSERSASVYFSLRNPSMELAGKTLRAEGESGTPHYAGTMFDSIPLETDTGPQINWLLSTLADFHPTVVGRCLCRCLERQPIRVVAFESEFYARDIRR
jgi:hypothetical protein